MRFPVRMLHWVARSSLLPLPPHLPVWPPNQSAFQTHFFRLKRERSPDESFGDWCHRMGLSRLLTLLPTGKPDEETAEQADEAQFSI